MAAPITSHFRELFAADGQLVDKAGNSCSLPEVTSSSCGILALHFTAVCFGDDFAPSLIEFCGRLKTKTSRQVDVITVSLDEDQGSFDELRATLPWPTLKTFDERGSRILESLRRRYRCHRLPCLILVDAVTGTLLTDIGRQYVLNDPEATGFPWSPLPSLTTLLATSGGGKLMNGFKETVDVVDALRGKLKGLYFSSHDCAPCQQFTPMLVESYMRIRSPGCQFEIVLVSGDDSEVEFIEHYSSMPWLAIPYGDVRIFQLESHFQISGYPQLVLLDENNKLITTEGCSLIMSDPKGWNFPWPVQVLEELTDENEIVLRFRPCLILLTGGSDVLINQAVSLLTQVAADYHGRQLKDSNTLDLNFLYEGHRSADAVALLFNNLQVNVQRSAETVHLQPRAILVDMKADRLFVCWSDKNSALDAVTDESLRHLVDRYEAGTLLFKEIPDHFL